MSAQPVEHYEDPHDPRTILADLPERERPVFIEEYRKATHAAADDLAGYQRLQHILDQWAAKARILKRVLAQRPNYYEELDASREALLNGTVETIPLEDVFPNWEERAAAASQRHYR
jgi:hypothetical protein